jgi:hypothetical protein
MNKPPIVGGSIVWSRSSIYMCALANMDKYTTGVLMRSKSHKRPNDAMLQANVTMVGQGGVDFGWFCCKTIIASTSINCNALVVKWPTCPLWTIATAAWYGNGPPLVSLNCGLDKYKNVTTT